MWGIPADLSESDDDDQLLGFAMAQIRDAEAFRAKVEELYDCPEESSSDLVELKDGRLLERYSQPMRIGREILGRLWAFRDISAQRTLEVQVRQTQKMEAVGRLAGGVAHDFSNLLTVILSHAGQILDDVQRRGESSEDAATLSEDATALSEAGARAAVITRQLLSFSRQQRVRPEMLDLNEFLVATTRLLGRLIGEHINLVLERHPAPLPFWFDRGQLEQIVMNLILNARDAMPGGGTLTVRARPLGAEETAQAHLAPDADHVAVEVEDSGAGIPDDVLARIFEPFFTTKEVGHGTGLGLATVHGIVEQSGGRVQVRSTVGRGTTFSVYLRARQAPASAARNASTGHRPATTGACVLVVEDEPQVRRIAAKTLSAAEYLVLDAAHGEEALALAATSKLDLVVTDVVMPRMSGVMLAERLVLLQPGVRILFMSGYPVSENGQLRCAAQAILDKPFTAAQLLVAVQVALEEPTGDPAAT